MFTMMIKRNNVYDVGLGSKYCKYKYVHRAEIIVGAHIYGYLVYGLKQNKSYEICSRSCI